MSTAVTIIMGTDRDAISSLRAGEAGSFEQVVHRYHRPVVAFVYRMVGDYETALDLTQEVFMKVFSALARYDDRFKFSTWLFKIASNHAIDYLRKQTGPVYSFEDLPGQTEGRGFDVQSEAPTPEQQAIFNERRIAIESAITELPVPYRQVIVLRHIAELEYEEIAEVTGLPMGTVKNRLFRAREAIRKKLLKRGIEGVE